MKIARCLRGSAPHALKAVPGLTWTAAGRVLLDAYRETIADTGNSAERGQLSETAYARIQFTQQPEFTACISIRERSHESQGFSRNSHL